VGTPTALSHGGDSNDIYRQQVYHQIVNGAINRSSVDGYTERHHIIPKSCGGSNRKDDLVSLSAREHYICHRLLVRMVEGDVKRKMIYGLSCMLQVKTVAQNRYMPSSRTVEVIKTQWRDSLKGRKTWNKGIPLSEEQKEKLRQANLGKTYTRSPEYLEKQRLAQTGLSRGKGRVSNRKGIAMSQEQKEKLSQSHKGKPWSEARRGACKK